MPLSGNEYWVFIDLDNTLFQARQALGHADWFYHLTQQRMEQGMSHDEAFIDAYPLWIKTQGKCPVIAVEASFIEMIREWQKNGVVVMGLTHRQPSVTESTVKQIASLGLDFTLTAPSKEIFSLPASTPTLYQQGVLFVGDYEKKGQIILSFFDRIGKRPQQVLFFDDKKANVEELDNTLAQWGIDVLGVHYRAIEKTPKIFHLELAEIQEKYFDQGILSNEAALLLRGASG